MSSSSSSSPPHSPHSPPIPRVQDLSKRGLHKEPMFDALSFKDQLYCNEAIETIVNSPLIALTKLPNVYYPRVVRKFYEHFTYECDESSGLLSCKVIIDGKEYKFTSKDIAKALNLKDYMPIPYEGSDDEFMHSLIFRPPPSNPKNEVRESFLHENFWVVHKFMRTYVCPYSHEHIVPQYLYKFWNGMYRAKKIDLPAFMIHGMINARDGGRVKRDPHGLVLPRAITAILKNRKFKFLANEPKESVGVSELFNYAKVKKSLEALMDAHNLRPKTKSKRVMAKEKRAEKERQRNPNVQQEQVQEQPQPMDTNFGGGQPSYMGDQTHQYSGSSSHQQFYPSQEQWETQMSNQNRMFTMMQEMHMSNQGYGNMWQGMQGQMNEYGEVLQDIRGTMHEMQGTLHSLDARVQRLEPRCEPIKTYQRKHKRKNTITIEEEHENDEGGAPM